MGQLSQISAPAEGLRALPIYQDLPFRPIVHLCQNDFSAPLIKEGEIVLVSEGYGFPQAGEIYVIEYPASRPWRRFSERHIVTIGESLDGKWFTHHLAQRSGDGSWLMADGPYTCDALIDMIVGRVVGIYDPAFARRAA